MFCDDFKDLLPLYNNIGYVRNTYTVHESSSNSKVKDVIWINSCFQYFDTKIAKDLTAFFQNAKANEIFRLDCDGAFLVQGDNHKYLFLNELKSTFDSADIYHASNQIVSTYIKLNMILNLLPNYRKKDIKVKRFIFSRPAPADKNHLRDLHRKSIDKRKQDAKGAELVLRLCCKKKQDKVIIKPSQCPKLKDIPLGNNALFDELELYHIDVKEPNTSIIMDTSKFL